MEEVAVAQGAEGAAEAEDLAGPEQRSGFTPLRRMKRTEYIRSVAGQMEG